MPFSTEYLLNYIATLNNKDYLKGLDEMEGKTGTTGKKVDSLGSKIGKLVNPTNLAAAAFTYMSYRTVQAVKDFAQFEKSLSKVNTLLGVSREELYKYGDGFIDLSIKTGKAKEEISEGAYQALSAGIADGELLGFLELATKGAIAGYSDVNTAVDGVTTVMNAYGLAVSDTEKIIDLMLKTQEKGKTTLGEMAQYLSDVIPIAASLDIEFSEVTASIATLTAAGTKTPQAITQIKSAMAELAKEGTTANKIFSNISGQTFPDFIKGGGTFSQALEMMEQYGIKTEKSMLDMFSSIEAGNAALGLTGGNAERFSENIKDMGEAAGTLEESYKLATDNMATQWDIFKARIDKDWMELGKGLIIPITFAIKKINDIRAEIDSKDNYTDEEIQGGTDLLRADGETLMSAGARLPEYIEKYKAFQESIPGYAREALEEQKKIDEEEKKRVEAKEAAAEKERKRAEKVAETEAKQRQEKLDAEKKAAEELEATREQFATSQADRETQYNSEKLIREWAFLDELGQLKLTGQITDEEFEARKNAYRENQAVLDEEFNISQLEKEAEYYMTKELNEEKYLEIKEELSEKRKDLDASDKKATTDKNKWDSWASKSSVDIQQKSADAILSTYNALASGQISSLSDFKNFAQQQISNLLALKGQEHAAIAVSDFAKGVSFASNPLTASLAPPEFSSAAQNAALAAAWGIGSAIVAPSDSEGDSGNDSSGSTTNPTSPDDIVEASQDSEERNLYVDVDDSDMAKLMVKQIEAALKDDYNVSLIANPKKQPYQRRY